MAALQNNLFPDTDPARFGNGRRRKRLILPKELRSAAQDERLKTADVAKAHQVIVKWADLETSGKLVKKNESAMKGEFLAEVFGTALGYTLFSENLPQWQFEPEFSVNGERADGAIGFFSAEAKQPPRAIVEIKGPRVDLDRHRSQGRTAVDQCWDYMYAIPKCPWGILCNYVSFRLYHREWTKRAYELFTLQELRAADRFREFYVLFSRSGLLPALVGQKARADDLLERSEHEQQQVGTKLYRDYRDQRLSLIRLLRGKPHERPLDDAIKIAQKLLDRVIFIAFCQKRDLLPSNTIARTYQEIPFPSNVVNPRWDNFKRLFRTIDSGHEPSGITPYNGGLFREDTAVDNLDLNDSWTDFFRDLGEYDFKDVVNVDVLGHIFEQSVTDLEALRINPGILEGERAPKTIGKRKREGIYYTPAHVTGYIVEKTVGRVLEERFAEAARRFDIDPTAEPTRKTVADWIKFNEARLKILRGLRVCDPACGSGAFLIQAYEYLDDAYDEVVTALCLHQGPENERLYDEISRHILSENLFGVDLSEEAVEITQLALWLKSARRGRRLDDLSENIQCGNSLVDDPKVDDRAFDWREKFAPVMAEGGFDCIIGNPPYVKLQNFRKREPAIAEFLVRRYRSAQTGNFDMYLPFIERGLELLRPDGRMGFIAPNVWLFNEYGQGLRELVAERGAMERFIDFKSHQIFADATTYTALQFFSGESRDRIDVADASHGDLKKLEFYTVPKTELSSAPWALLADREQRILDKMRERSVTLAEASGGIIVGIQTSADSIYHVLRLGPGRYYSHELEQEVELEDAICKPLVSGEDAVLFATPPTDKRLIFPYLVTSKECRLFSEGEMAKKFRRTWAYLKKNEKRLRAREGGKFDNDDWYRFASVVPHSG